MPLHIWTKRKNLKKHLTEDCSLTLPQQLSLALHRLILRGISTKTHLHKMGRLNDVDICQVTEKPARKTSFPMTVINLKTPFMVFLVLDLCDISFCCRTLRKKTLIYKPQTYKHLLHMPVHGHRNFWALFNIFVLNTCKSAFPSCGTVIPFKFLLSLSTSSCLHVWSLWRNTLVEVVHYFFLSPKEYPEGKIPSNNPPQKPNKPTTHGRKTSFQFCFTQIKGFIQFSSHACEVCFKPVRSGRIGKYNFPSVINF